MRATERAVQEKEPANRLDRFSASITYRDADHNSRSVRVDCTSLARRRNAP